MDRLQHSAFETCHAAVPALLFVAILGVTMLAVHPVVVGISLAGALACSALTRGPADTLRGLRWQLPMLGLVCLANPLFSASGSTLVAKVGPVSVYAESLAFGATMGALMVAAVLWMECAARVLAQDRLLSLAGGRARVTTLVVSMASALVPQLLRRADTVGRASRACTAAGPRPSGVAAAQRTSNLLMSWSLEDSLERADAMRARGWESGMPRTCFREQRVRTSDVLLASGVVLLAAASGLLAWVACSQWRFYPSMPTLVMWWGYVPFLILAFAPAAAELAERARRGRLS